MISFWNKQYFITHKTCSIFDDYTFDENQLGAGAYGVVYRVTEKTTGQIRACKQVNNDKITNYDGFMNEVQALKTLDHPNIIKLYEVYKSSDWVYLVTELCEGGELFDYILDNKPLSEHDSAKLFHQMVSAVLYWHKNCIWHRDLKPDNFMMSKAGPNATLKLIDFGLSRSFFKQTGDGPGEVIRMETRAGTSLYMAPEVLSGNYNNSCDIWSLGVILYIMMSCNLPFGGSSDHEIYESILKIDYVFSDENGYWETRSEEVKDLVSKMLVYEEDRITPKEALNHPWVRNQLKSKDKRSIDSTYLEKLTNFKDSNQLKKAILSFLATKTNDNDIQDEILLFHQFDTNHDSYITKKELKKGLWKLKKYSEEEVDEIMDSIDTDKNGAINFNEFISATLNSNICRDYERIYKAFSFFDLDNDGHIDTRELKEALAGQEFAKIDNEIFKDAITECDLDNDGKINFEEFAQAMSVSLQKKTIELQSSMSK